jgi:glycosyltransferase involved in cell wall biosynthesis
MKVTVLCHNLSTNNAMRAHRLAVMARRFAEVKLIGPVQNDGLWPALRPEAWIQTVPENRFPKFANSFIALTEMCDGDLLLACKPHLGSFGVALVAAERRPAPVVLDFDDLDTAFMPRADWAEHPAMADLRRPGSALYVSLLTRAHAAANAVITSSSALARRFAGTVVPHGCDAAHFDPARVDREAARREFNFGAPTVMFVGTPRWHKGLKPLAKAVAKIPGARLAVACRDHDFTEAEWRRFPLDRVPLTPYADVPRLIAAADVVAIPQLDTEASHYQMPMKAYDAMAMAAPIVASAISDLPQLLDGCGRLVPPGDVDALAAALRGLLDAPAEARALGLRGRARLLEKFTLGHAADTLRGVLERVISKSK